MTTKKKSQRAVKGAPAKRGRPPKGASAHKKKSKVAKKNREAQAAKVVGRKVSAEEIARELIEGLVVLDENGDEMRRIPTQREIAERLAVAHSLISRIAIGHDCARRHQEYRRTHPEPFAAYDAFEARLTSGEPTDDEPEPSASTDSTATDQPKKRRAGRPNRYDSPNVPWNEVDRLLVMGETVQLKDGTQSTRYPAIRELARRYGICHTNIVTYAREHHCERRREVARQRLLARTEETVIELRATAIAVSKDDALRMIDKFLLKFEKALDEDRVRYDAPADFNTMLRLKEFVMGGADSRQETTTTITLEALQERHARMLRETRELTPAEMGIIDVTGRTGAAELGEPNTNSGDIEGVPTDTSNCKQVADEAEMGCEAELDPPARLSGKADAEPTVGFVAAESEDV